MRMWELHNAVAFLRFPIPEAGPPQSLLSVPDH